MKSLKIFILKSQYFYSNIMAQECMSVSGLSILLVIPTCLNPTLSPVGLMDKNAVD